MEGERRRAGAANSGSGESAGFELPPLEYSFVNPIESDDGSVLVTPAGYQADLSLPLKVEASLDEVFLFVRPTEESPGQHTLRVKENINGLLYIDKERRWKVLTYPENDAILILRNNEPEWLERPEDWKKKYVLGQGEEGGTDWIPAGECKDANQ